MKNDCKKELKYIKKYWKNITFYFPKDEKMYIGLPNPFVSPSSGIYNRDQFYWDSYFTILGLIEEGEVSLSKGMVDNFVYLYNRFGIIPSRNRFYNLGISQIPFLTSMAIEVFKVLKDKKWLKKVAEVAVKELDEYWVNKREKRNHFVYRGLSRYCDPFFTDLTAEHESGWDMTSRFNNKCLDHLPIDLNSCLFKYESDLSEIFEILGEELKSKTYLLKAKKRKIEISRLMWNERKGFFFDYDYKTKSQSNFYSIAGFYPLWAGLASLKQAKKLKDNLKRLEYKGGLANTQKRGLSKRFKQHDYPNGWPQQHWIVVSGLLNYGFRRDAKRIAKKWLNVNSKVFRKTGKFWEKYDVVSCDIGKDGRYNTQSGFGWTNAVFLKLAKEIEK